MKMRAVVEIWLKSLIDEFTLGGLHSAMGAKMHQKGCSKPLEGEAFKPVHTRGRGSPEAFKPS